MNSGLIGLCLVLLMDSSDSIDSSEWNLQVSGTSKALTDEKVIEAAVRDGLALSVITFDSSPYLIVPWTKITTKEDVLEIANRVKHLPRVSSSSTNPGDALAMAENSFLQAPLCARNVVDISTDGTPNTGPTGDSLKPIVQGMWQKGIEINALVIDDEIDVVPYYEKLLNNEGFVIVGTFENYEMAIRKKLTLEITQNGQKRTTNQRE